MGIVKEFKEFALKGNLVDIAIGLIIGAAFGRVVSSLVEDVFMPPLGMIIGGVDFSDLKWVMKGPSIEDGRKIEAVTLNYGNFIQNLIDFLIVALAVFTVVKLMNRLKKKEQEQPAHPAPDVLTKEQILLTEIRDSLRNRQQ
ncbi:large-conductance mechanosensitive channel protein MscL [Pedobacter sp. SYSU D00535]|uniref:large-conductance mechanosensitive channel protein MscL n=1 Tax=Pedobacter sp. SYSU D00535 TaxID=2810308 RepID=UPI001A967ADF|nr:large-conductance mechanosensitive channel protein MscL [Pedobacter sp. SYSU D00535]